MNNSMNDFEELQERAREEEKEEREPPTLTSPNLGVSWTEEAARAEELRELAELNNQPIITAEQRAQAQADGRLRRFRPPEGHQVSTCVCDSCAFVRVAQNISFQVNCLGCGQPKDVGTLCPCGWTAHREELAQAQQGADIGSGLHPGYLGVLYGRPRQRFPTTLPATFPVLDTEMRTATGRLVSEPQQQFITRDYSDLETRVLASLRRDGARLDTAAMAHLLDESEGIVAEAEVRNVPCEVCGRVERIFASMVADGHYTCRRCREVGQNRDEYIRQELARPAAPARYHFDAKCNRSNCGRRAQRFTSLDACREYILVRNRICPACHWEALTIQEVDTQREERLAAARESVRETLNTIERQPIPRPRPSVRDIPYVPAVREDPEDQRRRLRQERMTFLEQMASTTGRVEAELEAYRLEEAQERQEEERAQSRFTPARKLDLDD